MGIRHVIAGGFGVSAVVLVACGGGASSSCGSYFDAVANLFGQCGVQLDTTQKAAFQDYCGVLATAPGAGDLASQIDHCASVARSANCDNGAIALECVIRGTLADGAACGNGAQCAGGRCDTSGATPSTTTEVLCGKCASYLAVGSDCSNGGACDPSTTQCTQGKCAAFVAQGQSCASAPCTPGLLCDGATTTCVPYPQKGQACTTACAYPSRCLQGTCADPVPENGACTSSSECATNLTCTNQKCVATTKAALGQPCGFVNNQVVDCQDGLKCPSSGTSPTCVAPKQKGEACTVGNGDCASDLACVGGTCQVPDFSTCK